MHVRQHIPGFVSGADPQEVEVATLDELLALPWLSRLTKDPTFLNFCWTSANEDQVYLIAQHRGTHWVMAYVWGDAHEKVTELPKWDPDESRRLPDPAPDRSPLGSSPRRG